MIVTRQIIAMIHQRSPRIGVMSAQEVRARRREDVDQRPVVQRHDAVRPVRGDVKAVARLQQPRRAVHRRLEAPRRDVGDLSVRVMVHRAHRAAPEVDPDHHQVGTVPQNLPAHALAHALPRHLGRAHERLLALGLHDLLRHTKYSPPLISIDSPVMYEEASDARNATAFATSSARPSRPAAVRATVAARPSGLLNVSWNEVPISPGDTQFTRIFRGASSLARPRLNVSTPPFALAYAVAPGPPPSCAASDERFTIAPPSGISGSTAFVTRKTLPRLRSSTCAKNASSISSTFFRATRPPALFTSTSTRPPSAARVSSASRATSSAFVTSARTATARPPSRSSSVTSVFACSPLLP